MNKYSDVSKESDLEKYSKQDIQAALDYLNAENAPQEPTEEKPDHSPSVEKNTPSTYEVPEFEKALLRIADKIQEPLTNILKADLAVMRAKSIDKIFPHGLDKDGVLGIQELLKTRNWNMVGKYLNLCFNRFPPKDREVSSSLIPGHQNKSHDENTQELLDR